MGEVRTVYKDEKVEIKEIIRNRAAGIREFAIYKDGKLVAYTVDPDTALKIAGVKEFQVKPTTITYVYSSKKATGEEKYYVSVDSKIREISKEEYEKITKNIKRSSTRRSSVSSRASSSISSSSRSSSRSTYTPPHTCRIDSSTSSISYSNLQKISHEERKTIEKIIERKVGSIPRIEEAYKTGPGRYILIDATGTKWEIDINTGEVKYTTPSGHSRTLRYDPEEDRKIARDFQRKLDEYKRRKEHLEREWEQLRREISDFNAYVTSRVDLSEEEYKRLIEHAKVLEEKRQKLLEEVEKLEQMYKDLIEEFRRYESALRTLSSYETLRELSRREQEALEFYQEILEQHEKEKEAYEIAKHKLLEQIEEARQKVENPSYLLPIPGLSLKPYHDIQTILVEEGLKELRQEIKDPELLMRAEKYYREMVSKALEGMDEEVKKVATYEALSLAIGFGIGKVAGSVAKIGSEFATKLPGVGKVAEKVIKKIESKIPERFRIAGTEYFLDVASDIALQKLFFRIPDIKSILVYNLIDFASIYAKAKEKIEKELKIEEFKFEVLKPEFKEIKSIVIAKPSKDQVTSTSKTTLETIEGDSKHIETGIRDGMLYREITCERDGKIIKIEEIKPPEEVIKMKVKFEGDNHWHDMEHIVVKKDGKSSLGMLTGEIEVDVGKQKQKVKIEEPIKITVHENAEVSLVYGPYRYTILESSLPQPKTGKLLEVETSAGKEFYELETKRAYGKEIIQYKAFDEEKGMTVVYDPKKKKGFGLDPEMVLEKPKQKVKTDAFEFVVPAKIKVKVDVEKLTKVPIKGKKAPADIGESLENLEMFGIRTQIFSDIDINMDIQKEWKMEIELPSKSKLSSSDVETTLSPKANLETPIIPKLLDLPNVKVPEVDLPPLAFLKKPKKSKTKKGKEKRKSNKKDEKRKVTTEILMEKITIV